MRTSKEELLLTLVEGFIVVFLLGFGAFCLLFGLAAVHAALEAAPRKTAIGGVVTLAFVLLMFAVGAISRKRGWLDV